MQPHVKSSVPPRSPSTPPLPDLGPPRRPSGTIPRYTDSVPIPRIELVVEREGGRETGREVVLDSDLCRIGSHSGNDLVLDDKHISSFHCRLWREGGSWRIADTGSLNGTRVGAVRVRDADLPLPECRISLGDSVVRVSERGSVSQADVPVWPSFGALIGSSLAMRRLFGVLDRVARTDATVLIEGESGTGKEIIATEVVRRGSRADKPFVIVDCGAVSPSLIESELFGHIRGSFTSADRDRQGAFEAADGGTVFLDEIGEMPLEMQPKLLRAIESREIRRVGENRARKVDVRLIAATNRRLEREVNHGRFREDLYFRLSVVTVRVPPLREHLEDLTTLVHHFLRQLEALDRLSLFTPEVMAEMGRYDWPGNVRELRNYIERAVVLEATPPASRRQPSSPDIAPPAQAAVNLEVSFKEAKDQVISEFEREYLTALLQWSAGNVSMASRKAGLDRMYLHRLIQRYGLKKGGSITD
jgi:DNA-binding NtrC family response regulator